MQAPHPIAGQHARSAAHGAPLRLWAGLALVLLSWWVAWFGPPAMAERAFFPLWLGYILTVDALTARRTGTSLWQRDPRRFFLLFVFSIPLWWLFEFANRYLGNWRYVLPRPFPPLEYALQASLSFSTVIPAIFVTAEFLRSLTPFARNRTWVQLRLGPRQLAAVSVTGLVLFLLSLTVPRYAFPLVWVGVFLLLDPINAFLGNPSITAQVRQGRWDTVLVLFAAGLTCGWFWELWNVFSMPKWVYEVPFVDRPKLFEMPLLGFGGYLPFALEVFAAWSLMQGLVMGHDRGWLRFTEPATRSATGPVAGCRTPC